MKILATILYSKTISHSQKAHNRGFSRWQYFTYRKSKKYLGNRGVRDGSWVTNTAFCRTNSLAEYLVLTLCCWSQVPQFVLPLYPRNLKGHLQWSLHRKRTLSYFSYPKTTIKCILLLFQVWIAQYGLVSTRQTDLEIWGRPTVRLKTLLEKFD